MKSANNAYWSGKKKTNNDCPVASNSNSKQQRKTSTGHDCDMIKEWKRKF
jgi:hypothetical protein